MDEDVKGLLTRIADALERLAPPAEATPVFAVARAFRHEGAAKFSPA